MSLCIQITGFWFLDAGREKQTDHVSDRSEVEMAEADLQSHSIIIIHLNTLLSAASDLGCSWFENPARGSCFAVALQLPPCCSRFVAAQRTRFPLRKKPR